MEQRSTEKCVYMVISGRVTGVGYRFWFSRRSEELGLKGYVRNRIDGRVEAYICGEQGAVDRIVQEAWSGSRWSKPTNVKAEQAPQKNFTQFQIRG